MPPDDQPPRGTPDHTPGPRPPRFRPLLRFLGIILILLGLGAAIVPLFFAFACVVGIGNVPSELEGALMWLAIAAVFLLIAWGGFRLLRRTD